MPNPYPASDAYERIFNCATMSFCSLLFWTLPAMSAFPWLYAAVNSDWYLAGIAVRGWFVYGGWVLSAAVVANKSVSPFKGIRFFKTCVLVPLAPMSRRLRETA